MDRELSWTKSLYVLSFKAQIPCSICDEDNANINFMHHLYKISIKKDRKGKDTNRWQLCSAQDIPLHFGFLRHKSQFWKNLVKITSLDNIIIIVVTWNIKWNEISNLILMVRYSNYFLYKSLLCWNPGHLDSCVIIVIHLHAK